MKFGDAIVAIEVVALPEGPQGKRATSMARLLLLGLGSRSDHTRQSRVGEHDGRDRVRLKRHLVSSNRSRGNTTFMGGFVGEHRFASHVPDGIDGRLSGATLCIDRNKSAWRDLDALFIMKRCQQILRLCSLPVVNLALQ